MSSSVSDTSIAWTGCGNGDSCGAADVPGALLLGCIWLAAEVVVAVAEQSTVDKMMMKTTTMM